MKILAIKGGGIRGVLAARLGERLDRRVNGWAEGLDLIAGTSTGSIIALALAAGHSWKKIRVAYEKHAAKIFARPVTAGVAQTAMRVANAGSLYSSEPLQVLLESFFGGMKLGDLDTDVLVPAVSITGDKPRALWFTRQREGNLSVVDVALASCAAPLYFSPHLGCVDGGLVANDPSVAAMLHTRGGIAKLATEVFFGRLSVLTLGCGRARAPQGLVDSFSDGGLMGPLARSMKMLGENHRELDPRLKIPVDLDGGDDPEVAVEDLLYMAEDAKIAGTARWLEEHGWGES